MPACVKRASPHNSSRILLLCLLGILTIAGCEKQVSGSHFQVRQVDATWLDGQVKATLHQDLKLSREAREALVHGVPLNVQMEIVLRNTGNQTRLIQSLDIYEIRYLPMSEHYQLSLPSGGEVRTFPRLRHLLSELSTVKLSFSTGVLPAGDYELLARTRLDRQKMPPPMRLPVLFSSQWRHDSDWSAWPVDIQPEA